MIRMVTPKASPVFEHLNNLSLTHAFNDGYHTYSSASFPDIVEKARNQKIALVLFLERAANQLKYELRTDQPLHS